jgi:hypothetical protein
MSVKSVPEMLRECAETYEQRSKVYGDTYKQFGAVMAALFPEGLTVKHADDWSRIGIMVQMVGKQKRYAENFQRGGHDDSLLDLSVYAQMLREVEAIMTEPPFPPMPDPEKKPKSDAPIGSKLFPPLPAVCAENGD